MQGHKSALWFILSKSLNFIVSWIWKLDWQYWTLYFNLHRVNEIVQYSQLKYRRDSIEWNLKTLYALLLDPGQQCWSQILSLGYEGEQKDVTEPVYSCFQIIWKTCQAKPISCFISPWHKGDGGKSFYKKLKIGFEERKDTVTVPLLAGHLNCAVREVM